MFCPNCGAKTVEGAKFCSSCGNQMYENFAAGESGGKKELPVMVLYGRKKEGLIKQNECYFVFFKGKIVFSFFTKDIQNREMKRLREDLKAEGKGFLKSSFEMMKFWSNYGNKYYNMTEKEILDEEKSNFSIENSEIKKIKFTASQNQQYENSTTTKAGEMIIETSNEKIKIIHNYFDSNRNIKKSLENLYGNRIKYKGRGVSLIIGNKEGFN